jgi:hypothetical protein
MEVVVSRIHRLWEVYRMVDEPSKQDYLLLGILAITREENKIRFIPSLTHSLLSFFSSKQIMMT